MNFWFDHYNYLLPITTHADLSYPGTKQDGGWSTWYPLTSCLRVNTDEGDFGEQLEEWKGKENWVRVEGTEKKEDLPSLKDLSLANRDKRNHFWTAQLRVRYCTEKL